jgi:hypothetical protein
MQGERSSTGSLRVQSDGERIDREQVEAAIRRELQILADIETQFENYCDGLDRSVVPPSMKAFILRQMQWRRRLRRMPHEAALRGCIRSSCGWSNSRIEPSIEPAGDRQHLVSGSSGGSPLCPSCERSISRSRVCCRIL